MASIDIAQLANEINRQLQQYGKAVKSDIDETAKRVAKDGVEQLREQSPKDTGDYAKGWTVKKDKNDYVVHNKTKPSLTHLLENSHLNRDGSRSQAQPHIGKVEQYMIKEFEEGIEKAVQQK